MDDELRRLHNELMGVRANRDKLRADVDALRAELDAARKAVRDEAEKAFREGWNAGYTGVRLSDALDEFLSARPKPETKETDDAD